MIYDERELLNSKESKKQSMRHSILDDMANDKELCLDSAESGEIGSASRRNRLNNGGFATQAFTEDQFRKPQIIGSMKEAAAGASSMRSLGQVSNCDGESEHHNMSDDLEKISI